MTNKSRTSRPSDDQALSKIPENFSIVLSPSGVATIKSEEGDDVETLQLFDNYEAVVEYNDHAASSNLNCTVTNKCDV